MKFSKLIKHVMNGCINSRFKELLYKALRTWLLARIIMTTTSKTLHKNYLNGSLCLIDTNNM